MKKQIHPKYYPEAKITCSCGRSFTAGSTRETLRVDICSACHPYYTGKSKFIDTKGRVERFEEKRAAAAQYRQKKSARKSSPSKTANQ